jgi:hypothetical protein
MLGADRDQLVDNRLVGAKVRWMTHSPKVVFVGAEQ